ncbi:MAG: glutamine--fructose-6-phosphate transaminase (isomerizing) [Deltaproteobacteria bacterium]|nr:MAG: glutamine--fructose-6-phosphate transaminase (isomerizing) [Deltaproteobacteria bacterium]
MCGIVGYVGELACGEVLLDGLSRLEYRGYDSAGIAIWDGESIRRVRAEGKLFNLDRRFRENPIEGSIGIGHTRWATHGAPVERNAHPHRVDDVVLVHNGIIENHTALRQELEAEGRVFESDTDTEVLAHLVARERAAGHDLLHAVRRATGHVRGSWAVVVLDAHSPDELVAARHASPLVIGLGSGENFAASDVPAILRHTRRMIFLEDGDTVRLTRTAVEITAEDGSRVERTPKAITWDPVAAEKQGYKHFMLKEIHEQGDRIVDTLRGRILLDEDEVTLPSLATLEGIVPSLRRIVILACGTSWHAGLVGRYAIGGLARLPVEVELASEFRYRNPVMDGETLAIAISQSGETADTLAAIEEAKRLGARTMTICNVMESSMTRAVEATLYTHAGPEIGVASTKAYTTQLSALLLLALWLGQLRGTIPAAERQATIRSLRALPRQIEEMLGDEALIREVGREYMHARSMLFLGRGNEFPTALEGALKLKEISYIHAEGYAAGEMKHGPIALIDEELPVVVVAPRNRLLEKTMSNLEEVRARGGRVIAVGDRSVSELERHADHVLHVPSTTEWVQPILSVIPLQLFAYAIADLRGTDVDQPRNLAKSVTVE